MLLLKVIPQVDEDGLAEAVSSASELEQFGLSLCCVSSIESMKEQLQVIPALMRL